MKIGRGKLGSYTGKERIGNYRKKVVKKKQTKRGEGRELKNGGNPIN